MLKITTIKERNIFEKISREEANSKLIEIFGSTNVTKKQVDLYPYSYDITENEIAKHSKQNFFTLFNRAKMK